MDARATIRAFLEIRGPSLPYAVGKEIGVNVTFASAYLAEMSDRGMVRISNLKVGGGSPLYYLPGQESQLQNFAQNLGEKQKKAFDMLKEKQVLRDRSLEPVIRAAMRDIKDFAVPCEVKHESASEIVWKWYLLPDADAKKRTAELLGIEKKKPASAAPAEVKRSSEAPKSQERPLPQQESQQKLQPGQEAKILRPSEPPQVQVEAKPESRHHASELYQQVLQFFQDKGIRILEENVLRKTEMDFIVDVPSPAGNLRYFVKAKSKKTIGDGDLSSLFFQSQSKRLPALLLAKGELTRKAQEMLSLEFRGMKVVRL